MEKLEPWMEYLNCLKMDELDCDCSTRKPTCDICKEKAKDPRRYFEKERQCPCCKRKLKCDCSTKEICNDWSEHSIKLGAFVLVLRNQREVQRIVSVDEPDAVSQLPGGVVPVPHIESIN